MLLNKLEVLIRTNSCRSLKKSQQTMTGTQPILPRVGDNYFTELFQKVLFYFQIHDIGIILQEKAEDTAQNQPSWCMLLSCA